MNLSSSSAGNSNNPPYINTGDFDGFDSESWIATPTSSAPPSYTSDTESFNDAASFVSDASTLAAPFNRLGLSGSSLVHLRPPSVLSTPSVTREYSVIRYHFTPTSPVSNSLTLVPPADMPDTVPRFHIVVTPNVFNPLSQITTVYRGETQFGQWVGSLDMGISNFSSRVRMHKKLTGISMVLTKRGSRTNAIWTWKPLSSEINNGLPWEWDYRHASAVCRSSNADKTLLATFIPARVVQVNERGEETPLPALQVTLAGQKFFEDILISLLAIERRRVIPTTDQQTIFN